MVNMLWPGKGKEIDGQLERLVSIKKVVQQAIRAREKELAFKVEIAEQRARIIKDEDARHRLVSRRSPCGAGLRTDREQNAGERTDF